MNLGTLTRLLQLSSPTLPVGAYSYSQGLETALASGLASSPMEVEAWIADHLHLILARNEGPYWWRLYRSWATADRDAVVKWNDAFLASRDGAEALGETTQMGFSLSRLLCRLVPGAEEALAPLSQPSFPATWTFAATRWEIPPREALSAYLWSWLETQVLAWMKTGGIGQQQGQEILLRLAGGIPTVVESSERLPDDELNTVAPGLALTAFAHEIEDGRLFRS